MYLASLSFRSTAQSIHFFATPSKFTAFPSFFFRPHFRFILSSLFRASNRSIQWTNPSSISQSVRANASRFARPSRRFGFPSGDANAVCFKISFALNGL
jgi:hypothetical protein